MGHNIIGPSVRPFVCLSVRLSVCPSVRIFFFKKGMPFKLCIYLGAFVTYCDPILVFYTLTFYTTFYNMIMYPQTCMLKGCTYVTSCTYYNVDKLLIVYVIRELAFLLQTMIAWTLLWNRPNNIPDQSNCTVLVLSKLKKKTHPHRNRNASF